ncbi:hypothetical protein HK405_015896 [Cladochytrium tenue]|nr:hypothetical protein HK405_015896 [Cladochytrium tenue]
MGTKTDIELGGQLIPAGTPMMLLPRVAALRASALDDGFAFRPERWIEMEDDKLVVFTAATVARFKVSFLEVPPHLELSQSFLHRPVKFEKWNMNY